MRQQGVGENKSHWKRCLGIHVTPQANSCFATSPTRLCHHFITDTLVAKVDLPSTKSTLTCGNCAGLGSYDFHRVKLSEMVMISLSGNYAMGCHSWVFLLYQHLHYFVPD
ncbi:hypothetical protein PV10_05289 [Exophiala mesophila]|uniref:Uncharacterized protein n=1 Tax=Exophiala mesophila TaxID=212818 RepID=A0A0D1XRD7_EXOME|nr:uncharacterized protein PV10_05289 [Exophiala mesophila]KIV90656.1 hypothetical protein PV10_05289 [Exophiala mesophila]